MTSRLATLLPALCTLAPLGLCGSADTPTSGWAIAQHDVAPPIVDDPFGFGFDVVGLTAILADGDVLLFDGELVERYTSSGTFVAQLGALPGPTFPALLDVAPGGDFALVGESSTGDLYRLALPNGPLSILANIPNTYDVAFESDSHAILSAACSAGCGNSLVRLNCSTGEQTLLATVDGPSGPVALDSSGNLYYGTISNIFGAEDQGQVLRFESEELDGTLVLHETDASLIGAGYDTLSSLAVDPDTGVLFAAENNLATGGNRIARVASLAAIAETLVAGGHDWWISELQFRDLGSQASFEAFQPQSGGQLTYQSTLYASTLQSRATVLHPRRAAAALEGPGVGSTGSVTFAVTGAPTGPEAVDAILVPLFGPAALYTPNEVSLVIAGSAPLHTGLHLGTIAFGPATLVLDGESEIAFWNPGLQNAIAIQGLLLSVDSAAPIATTTTVIL